MYPMSNNETLTTEPAAGVATGYEMIGILSAIIADTGISAELDHRWIKFADLADFDAFAVELDRRHREMVRSMDCSSARKETRMMIDRFDTVNSLIAR